MKKRMIAMLLSICLMFSLLPLGVIAVDESYGISEDGTVEETEAPEATDAAAETESEETEPEADEPTVYEQMMAAEDTSAMYALVLDAMNNEPETLNALTSGEIASLCARINELDPEGDDTDTADLLETLAVLPNGGEEGEELEGEPEAYATTTTNQTWQGSKLTSNGTQELGSGATITLRNLTDNERTNRGRNANFVVPNGVTLTLKGYGSFARGTGNTGSLIYVEQGGTLIIEGTSKNQPLIIDGKGVIANTPLIYSEGTVILKNAVIQNGKNRSVNSTSGAPNGQGGGITITANGSLSMENSVITKNTASLNGGGIYSTGPVTIKNSEISWNRAMSSETGDGVVNAGRGGGFAFGGAASVSTFENVLVTQNAAMYYGGGGQISGNATLTMSGTTTISYNEALLHGAAGLHVTSDATFTMNGGSIEYNTAQTVGGGIHSSYSCTLNLNAGSISNNTANGRGGGVHVNTGGAITLGAGLTINGNRVNNEPTGSYADVDATGDNWSNIKKEGPQHNNGYGGGILIDSGTCTVEGATISGNHAAVGGGGIALTMLNMSDGGLDDLMVIGFTMTSGTITENTTDGDGSGVYLMSNKAKERLIATYGDENSETYNKAIQTISTKNRHIISGLYNGVKDILNGIPVASVSGGTIHNNRASGNGGGLYLGENTKFTISGTGDISDNTATDGAGAYVASGTAEIQGGTISENKASGEGGAIYVNGTVTMSDGVIDKNEAVDNGGAVYITGGNFTMTSGKIIENKATGAGSNGGGVYVSGGNIVIGVNGCGGGEPDTNHTVNPTDKIHPVISNNSAVDSGGGIALMGTGNIVMYCGDVKDNDATNRGRGLNVYMENGQFDYHKGADVGKAGEPEVVIVGGELIDHNKDVNDKITLQYHHCNDTDVFKGDHTGDLADKTAKATKNTYINLPDGEKYWTAPEGYRFFGWTFYGTADIGTQSHVRDKSNYKAMGDPIKVEDVYDNDKTNATIDMYALWAPITNYITYVGSVVDDKYEEETLKFPTAPNETYTFDRLNDQNIVIPNPVKPGYDFVGWYLYQKEGKNANWGYGYEPVYKTGYTSGNNNLNYDQMEDQFITAGTDGTTVIKAEARTFGDIVLIAKFTPAFTDLKITKNFPEGADYSVDKNQSFLFKIEGTPYNTSLAPIDMTVTIQGNGEVTIQDLPVGKYTVTELKNWSWRYDATDAQQEVDLKDPEKTEELKFENNRNKSKWLDGEKLIENIFAAIGGNS